ncbi:protein MOTHER of FT and TFL1-like [Papaver somniferum]|uniref:protein MOTHER of FT and TFL1-like n=1 Tax=Papaver somniferum TaxID=3469 RepID=UPI000E705AB5|nr:protein MOTHER of FT and TFL1-like [Papaver somniferum]
MMSGTDDWVDPRQVDPLVVGRVIGDVVGMFVPRLNISVCYGSKHLTSGCEIEPSVAADPPKVQISGSPQHLYTLVMVDPDAPSPSEPTMREIVVDVPGGTSPSEGKEVVRYMGPKPPVGMHRYVMVAFEQKGELKMVVEEPACRPHFNTRNFAQQYDLGIPVSAFYFNSQKE